MPLGIGRLNDLYDRRLLLAAGVQIYVALAALQQGGAALWAALGASIGPLSLTITWSRTERWRTHSGRSLRDPTAILGLRLAVWGAGLWVAARAGVAGLSGLDAVANLACGACAVGGQLAMARIIGPEGLVRPPRSARSLDAALLCALLWGIAASLPAVQALWSGAPLLLDPLSRDYATVLAASASVLTACAAALRVRITRRLELGVADRGSGALSLSLVALCVGLPVALSNIAAPDRVLSVAAMAAGLASAWCATHADPAGVSRALRAALVVAVSAVPVTVLIASLAQGAPSEAGRFVLFAGAVGVLCGVWARRIAQPLDMVSHRWLQALANAREAAMSPEPSEAIRASLIALQGLEPGANDRAELWRADPAQRVMVDAAGYAQTEAGRVPHRIYELASREPSHVLRTSVLRALQVRSPEVRPALDWLLARNALGAVLMGDSEETAEGVIVVPQGRRKAELTLEEAQALGQLAQRLVAVFAVSSTVLRAQEREALARGAQESSERARDELRQRLQQRRERQSLLPRWLARRATVACYSHASRVALQTAAQLSESGVPVALLGDVGADLLAWAAHIHVEGQEKSGPLVLLDAAAQNEISALRADLQRAMGGTAVLLQPHQVGSAGLTEILLAWASFESAQPRLIVAATHTAEEAPEWLSSLQSLCFPSVFRIPPLRERPEDLRGLVLDALCTCGAQSPSRQLGVSPSALRLLVDHEWKGNEAELRQVVSLAAFLTEGPQLNVSALQAAGFAPALGEVARASGEWPISAVGAPGSEPMRIRRRRRK